MSSFSPLKAKSAGVTSTWKQRLGKPHFAYLRAWIEGVPLEEAGRRYLGAEHGQQIRGIHAKLVAELRALSRRAGDKRWRLIGVDLGARSDGATTKAPHVPDLYTWAEGQGMDGWTESELLEMYAEAFPVAADPGVRRARRNERLRERQLQALAELEQQAATPAHPSDPVESWFEPATTQRLQAGGLNTLGQLHQEIQAGGRWYRRLPAVGVTKATRIAQFVESLLSEHFYAEDHAPVHAVVSARAQKLPSLGALPGALDGSRGTNRSPRTPTIGVGNDREAIAAWIGATARSPLTADAYRREAERWLLWCILERGKALSSAGPDDCMLYMAFLNRIPAHWQSRRPAARMELGWTPFRGALSLASRRFAVKVLHLMCQWLTVSGQYLDSNPWAAVHRGLVDGQELPPAEESRALTSEAYEALLSGLPDPSRPGATRNGFILSFARYTGLRASELLSAEVGHFSRNDYGWRLRVVGKGRKPRFVSVPSVALQVLHQQLSSRSLELAGCTANTRLLVAQDGRSPVTYSAVHQSFTRFVQKSLAQCALSDAERARTARATQHWLRHTFATRAAEANVPEDVLMAELGHTDRTATARYYRAQERRRQLAMEQAAGFSGA